MTGHPENKYVLSRGEAIRSPGVHKNSNGNFQVQYDATGALGHPIVQPNKYQHFQRLAYRVGRDLRSYLERLGQGKFPPRTGLQYQMESLEDTLERMETDVPSQMTTQMATEATTSNSKNAMLKRMALDLHHVAPDLAEHAGFDLSDPSTISEQQAAALLQMQILEEANNNWELRFPENEHVWDFASVRLEYMEEEPIGRSVNARPRVKQFFSMRKYPLCCQSKARQEAISALGPEIHEMPMPPKPADLKSMGQVQPEVPPETQMRPKKVARHLRGQTPHFPFGESQYSRAWLSFRMEQDLKDGQYLSLPALYTAINISTVPEFQPQKPKWSLRRFFAKRPPEEDPDFDPFALPDLPKNWKPDNASFEEKYVQLIEYAKKAGDPFPDGNILEYYHTPAEIAEIKRQEDDEMAQAEVAKANMAIEKHVRKKLEKMTDEEVMKARMELRIDAYTGKFLPRMANVEAEMNRRGEEGMEKGKGGGIAERRAAKKGGVASPVPVNTKGGEEGEVGQSSNTRSKSPQKRNASAPAEEQRALKKSRVV